MNEGRFQKRRAIFVFLVFHRTTLLEYWRALFIACDPAIRTGVAGILEGYSVSGRLTDDYDGIKSLIPGPVLCQPKQKE